MNLNFTQERVDKDVSHKYKRLRKYLGMDRSQPYRNSEVSHHSICPNLVIFNIFVI